MDNLTSKITFKSVCGAPKTEPLKITDENGKEKTVLRGVQGWYMRVYGQVSKMSVKTTDYGDSIEFAGDIRAIDIETGEVFSSGKCYLPAIAEAFLAGIVGSVEKGSIVNFGFDIGVKPANVPTGYEFMVKPLIDRQESDPLLALANSFPELPKALPKPEKQEKQPAKKVSRETTEA